MLFHRKGGPEQTYYILCHSFLFVCTNVMFIILHHTTHDPIIWYDNIQFIVSVGPLLVVPYIAQLLFCVA